MEEHLGIAHDAAWDTARRCEAGMGSCLFCRMGFVQQVRKVPRLARHWERLTSTSSMCTACAIHPYLKSAARTVQ